MEKINIIGISGSLRKGSYNTIVLENIQNKFSDKVNLEIADISQIPFFNEDIENDDIESVKTLKEKVLNADAVILAGPEYNYSLSAVLKNAIDWLSRGDVKPLVGKKVAILSATLGFLGGARMQSDLREILLCIDADVIKKPEVFIGSVYNKIGEHGEIIDQPTLEIMEKLIDQLILEVNRGK